MITLTYNATTYTLPVDYRWSDEQNWQPVEQNISRTLTGALIVEVAQKIAGRPITLQPEDASCAWMTLSMLTALRAWAAVPGRQMVLTIAGTSYDVMFRHQDDYGPPFDTDFYLNPRHCAFTVAVDGVRVDDLHPLNGVYRKIEGSIELQHGDTFRVGQELLYYEDLPEPEVLPDGAERRAAPTRDTGVVSACSSRPPAPARQCPSSAASHRRTRPR